MFHEIKKRTNGLTVRLGRNSRLLPLAFSLLFIVGAITLLVAAASPVSLYLAPASKPVNRGSSFSVAVRASTQGNSIDYVKAYINFPADKLSVAGVSAAGSSFDYQLETEVSGNQVRIARYSTTGVKNGDLLVATITFTAINTGTAAVNFDAASIAIYTGGGSNQPATATSGGTYQISAPVSPPAPNPQPPSVAPPTPSATPPSSPPASPTASPPSIPSNPANEPSPNALPPATVTSMDKNEDLYPVALKINDHTGKPAAGVEVRAGEASVITDDSGLVSLLMPQGDHTIYVKSKDISRQFSIHIEARLPSDGAAPAVQEINLVLPDPGSDRKQFVKYGSGIILAGIALAAVYIAARKILKRRQPKPAKLRKTLRRHSSPIVAATVKPEHHAQAAGSNAHHEHTPAATVHKHQPEPEINVSDNSAARSEMHPHDKAKTIQPLSAAANQSASSGNPPAAAAREPAPAQLKPQAAQAKPQAPKTAPAPTPPPLVEPYKPDGEPKDIFEMAEERFNNDERLKDLRK